MDTAQTKKKGIWNWIDNIQGDKVIWMIAILLILFSCISVFSSTSTLVTSEVSRLDLFAKQMKIVCLGVVLIFICYFIPKIWVFRVCSQLGFLASVILLGMLVLGICTDERNSATRALLIGGLQLNVYEVVKVAMVMYLSWASNANATDSFRAANKLSLHKHFSWLKKPFVKRTIYIYIPILVVMMLELDGGFSSTAIIAAVMVMTVLLGGIPFKECLMMGLAALAALLLGYGVHKISGGTVFTRYATVENRIDEWLNGSKKKALEEMDPNSEAYEKAKDGLLQTEGAMMAIKEGGFFGKGPGKSTYKYTVSLIFSDYMFSFIIEEYGILFGAIPLLILYLSLLARGSIIVRNCDNVFAKTAVGGLTLLISFQAIVHMMINVGILPSTGQTLPMISLGNGSFLMFSLAFGIILSISKMAKQKVEMEAAAVAAEPLVVRDEVKESLNDLDILESIDS